MTEGTLVTLPGFLNIELDWSLFDKTWKRTNGALWGMEHIQLVNEEVLPYSEWVVRFNKRARKWMSPRVLIGYSMGARLAMHAILDAPSLWAGVVFVSGNPGLKEPYRTNRLNNDLEWSKKFKDEPWDEVIKEWQGRRNESSSTYPKNLEAYKDKLSQMLDVWSLGRQEELSHSLLLSPVWQLWVVGEEDEPYKKKLSSFTAKTQNVVVIPQAHHRVPLENKEVFIQKIQEFLHYIDTL